MAVRVFDVKADGLADLYLKYGRSIFCPFLVLNLLISFKHVGLVLDFTLRPPRSRATNNHVVCP
jgi:hypothetical protein